MLALNTIVARIKSQCGSFSSRVAGSAELEAAMQKGPNMGFAVPHAYVLYDGSTAGEDLIVPETLQIRRPVYVVVAAIDNTGDERGKAASDTLVTIDAELIAALVGWDPTADSTDWPMELESDEHVAMDRARLWHAWRFRHATQIGTL